MHKIIQKLIIFSLAFGLIFICLTGCEAKEEEFLLAESSEIEVTQEDYIQETSKETKDCYVFICGQILNPGVYCVSSDSRICDVIDMAGGCLETADICAVNQAALVTDGSQIYIPAVGECEAEGAGSTIWKDSRINLNQATKEELMTLPGIGETKAEQILEYRENHGSFSSIDELMNISGIKEGVFQKIQDYIRVE